MDSAYNGEYKALLNELIQGMECAKQLRVHLNSAASSETQYFFVQRILSSYEKALLILKWRLVGQSHPVPPLPGAPESSMSLDGSLDINNNNNNSFKEEQQDYNVSKKRKAMPTWTEQVRVGAENGLEGPTEDGYSWRKYGQKDILGAKYPRSYYRCTFRLMHNCWATKQVQRSDDDPTVFDITYKGAHTCNLAPTTSVPPLRSPENQQLEQIHHQNESLQAMQSNQMLMNLRANLRVSTDGLDTKETAFPFSFPPTFSGLTDENQHFQSSQVDDNAVALGTYSLSFVSPTTPDSNYFSASQQHTNAFKGVHISSANTSSTNSPIVGLDYSLHPATLDPNFPFDTLEFLT
ncbi:PREDICTED: probable WRKY transcription factor 53 [Ipomoea nil]|uniref:probable WRKY transcription factor 53 n=1 Tax=Ipomoea nil TaxID=35883 RepID=UPI0009011AB8|nr:PREDICTED: probable WRKY transcription factor 53 [Ipomoea nil]